MHIVHDKQCQYKDLKIELLFHPLHWRANGFQVLYHNLATFVPWLQKPTASKRFSKTSLRTMCPCFGAIFCPEHKATGRYSVAIALLHGAEIWTPALSLRWNVRSLKRSAIACHQELCNGTTKSSKREGFSGIPRPTHRKTLVTVVVSLSAQFNNSAGDLRHWAVSLQEGGLLIQPNVHGLSWQ